MSPRPDPDTFSRPHDKAVLDDLGKLAAALTERGYLAQVLTPADRRAFVHARNPEVAALSERIFAQADSFCWPWNDPIATRDQPATAAITVARVLSAPLTPNSPSTAPVPVGPGPDATEPDPDLLGDPSDAASVGDLAELAAELNARGYTTALSTQPPSLAIGAPNDSNHGHIITVGPCFCLDEVPFSLRPPMPLTMTADALDVLTHLTTCRLHHPH